MSDNKQLVGEAKRKADRTKAREIVGVKPKKPTAEQLGVSAVVGNRGKVRSKGAGYVIPELEESGICADKPFGDEDPRLLELDAILDDVEAKIIKLEKRVSTKKDIQDDLNQYFAEATSHHSAEGYSLVHEIERRLGTNWWSLANKGETLPALIARAIKHLATPQPTQTVVVVESKHVQQTIASRAVAKPVVVEYAQRQAIKEASVSKPRGEGWNGLSSSAIFRWCGSQGWSREECVKIISVLGLTGVSEKSLPTLLKAGKDGFRLPIVSPEIADALNRACGRISEQVYSKPKSK